MSFLTPPPLRQGDRVAVVAPSGPFDRPTFEKGLEVIARRYQPVFSERVFQTHRYLAGTDASRGAELQAALDDANVKAVFAARGGYGSMKLLPSLRLSSPKHLVGFSDFTSLHCAAQKQGWRSLHAPVLTQLGKQPPEVIERLFSLLEGQPVAPLTGSRTVNKGIGVGPLLGGNLSVFTRLIGTRWLPDLRGAVLLIEDVGEKPYRLDRMWMHLQLAGLFDGVKGIVFGEFTGCDENDSTSADVLDELALTLGIPCAAGFRIGHGEVNQPVMLGAPVRLDADAQTLSFP
ncbi:MAG: LD-carboxypeptidase [Archangium sp.]|nr:LD-carboxypeptidase [Archangium sp.]MDP3154948.1 LD-carboxypeptidase [Archangium sp.]MDP3576067.1 LD-carboxypeptidase [Archangium sp.]